MEDDDFISPPSLKQKLKNYLCFSCCFRHRSTTHLHSLDYRAPPPPSSSDEKPSLIWVKTKTPYELPDIKDKCRTIFNFISNGNRHHKRHSSAEFRYDPLSYALNFEDGYEDDEAPFRNFTSRLLPPPPPPVPVTEPVSVTADDEKKHKEFNIREVIV